MSICNKQRHAIITSFVAPGARVAPPTYDVGNPFAFASPNREKAGALVFIEEICNSWVHSSRNCHIRKNVFSNAMFVESLVFRWE
jgi:hypothetical protein